MRLARALLFGGLTAVTAPVALADEAKPADPKPEPAKVEGGRKVPLRVVRMLPETHQVLLYDKNRGTHVAAEVGQDVGGYIVDEIDGDEVTLVAPSGAEVILTAPDMSWRRRAAERKAAKAGKAGGENVPDSAEAAAAPASHEMGPVDPYADAPVPAPASTATPAPATSAAAPLTAGEGGVRVASTASTGPAAVVPADPYADPNAGITAFADAVGATAPAPAPTAARAPAPKADAKVDAAAGLAAAATGAPAVAAPAVAPAAPAAPAFTVTRSEIDTALADFGATAVTFDAAFVTGGLRFDHIAKGTILSKLGLQAGDILSAVDNQPIRSLDDAASLYARAGTAKGAMLHVVRAGKPVSLTVTIR